MDASDVFMAIVLIGCAGWITWATITSRRRARESGNMAEDAAGGAGDAGLPGAPESSRGVLPVVQTPPRPQASAPSAGRTTPRAGRRRR